MKLKALLLSLLPLFAWAQAPIGINALPQASPLSGTEAMPCEQTGTKKCTAAQLATYAVSVIPPPAAVNASNITQGTLPCAQLPALSGLISSNGCVTSPGSGFPTAVIIPSPTDTFDQTIAKINATVAYDWVFGSSAVAGSGQTAITNLTQLAAYFNPWGDSMLTGSDISQPQGINGQSYNSVLERFQAFNSNNFVFGSNGLALTAVVESPFSYASTIVNGAGGSTTYPLPATGIPISTIGLSSTTGINVGQIGFAQFGCFFYVTAVVANTSLSIADLGIDGGCSSVGFAFNNLVVFTPYYYTTLSASLSNGATGASLSSVPTGVVNGMMFSILSPSSSGTMVSNSTNRITISGSNVTFDNPWTYSSTFAIGTGVILKPPITSGQLWTRNYYLSGPVGSRWVLVDWYVTFPTDSVGGYNMIGTTCAAGNVTNTTQLAAVPSNFPMGSEVSLWVYGGNYPVIGGYDKSEIDVDTMNYDPNQGPWVDLPGAYNSGAYPSVDAVIPSGVTSSATCGEGIDTHIIGSPMVFTGTSQAGTQRESAIITPTQVYLYKNNVFLKSFNFQWTGKNGWMQFGMQEEIGTFKQSGRDLNFPTGAVSFTNAQLTINRFRILVMP